MDTLFLNPQTWDLALDTSRNIALATNPYALAQDAASAILTFLGEVYNDTKQGIPYFNDIFGELPPLELVKAQMVARALTVPGVVEAAVYFSSFENRTLSGQVQVTDTEGNITAASF